MIQWMYNLAMWGFECAIRSVAPFHPKARLAIAGRANLLHRLHEWRAQHQGSLIWFHCASLGEFEQGRNLIEEIRQQHPQHRLLLTFFSPSGYEIRKNYGHVDGVFYLPFDRFKTMKATVQALEPSAVCIVKYEYWVNWYKALQEAGVPIFLVSAKLRHNQRFFGRLGWWWQKTLRRVNHFFVQDDETMRLLQSVGIESVTQTGDTRFDRVHTIRQNAPSLEAIATWCGQAPVLVVGSAWKPEASLALALGQQHRDWKIILVPHEVDSAEMQRQSNEISGAVLYSQLTPGTTEGNILLVNATGILSAIYQYANVVVIGGGFGKGIHNTLEAATWGKYILFGPRYEKFAEAVALIEQDAATVCATASDMAKAITTAMTELSTTRLRGQKGAMLVEKSIGATKRIMQHTELQSILKK